MRSLVEEICETVHIREIASPAREGGMLFESCPQKDILEAGKLKMDSLVSPGGRPPLPPLVAAWLDGTRCSPTGVVRSEDNHQQIIASD
jgi:hypothetical protein